MNNSTEPRKARPHGNGEERPRSRGPTDSRPARPPLPQGLLARQAACEIVSAVLERHRALDDVLTRVFSEAPYAALEPRDKALAHLIASTILRRHGELAAIVRTFLAKPLPEKRGQLWPILLSGAVQLVLLDTPPHAVLNIAVEQCRKDPGACRFDKLTNAVLRRVSEQGRSILQGLDGPRLNIPDWLWTQWTRTYGDAITRQIAVASLREACLDLTVKADPGTWVERTGGILLATGSIRGAPQGRIEDIPGFAEGAWWVQDAAAALPARLLGNVAGRSVADLCAAPGGKTAELCAAGARVTAVDQSQTRLSRVAANLTRLNLSAELIAADATQWQPDVRFDAVLLDAPCSSTGTIRRHPDILHLKRADDLQPLVELQARLLDNAASLVKSGGLLVYCTCSLEAEEGIRQADGFLRRHGEFTRRPILASEIGAEPDWLTPEGDLRTLPFHTPGPTGVPPGMDGFYAIRLKRNG